MVLAEDLRQAVLQAALQGRLTEQLETDSNVDEMLKNIQKEKEKLIADKKIKKEKPLPEIQEEEIPFDIPESWRWVRLQDVVKTIFAGGDKPKIFSKEKTDLFSIPVIANGETDNGVLGYTNDAIIKEESLTISGRGTIGFSVIRTEPYVPIVRLLVITPLKQTNLHYIQCVLRTLGEIGVGTAVKQLTVPMIQSKLIPFPPSEEQKRIVDKINEIMPEIDEYEKIEKELEALKKAFPENVKSALLQAAMQGNLTEQLENDSNVDELLLNIEKDREDKINSGLVKNDKRLFTKRVDDEKTSLTIPDSWRSVTLGSILYKLTDGTHKTPKYVTNGVKFVSVKDMSLGKLDLSSTKFITKEEHEELYNRCNPEKGDMLLSKIGTTGVPAIVDTDEKFSLFVSVALLKYNHQFIDEKFLYYLICSPLVQEQVKENTRGVGNKNWVLDFIAKTVIVLPPIEEQKRIVERLEALLPLCEGLENE